MLNSEIKLPKEHGKFDRMSFGKYKGDAICTVMANEPAYLLWCLNTIRGFRLDFEMECQLREGLQL